VESDVAPCDWGVRLRPESKCQLDRPRELDKPREEDEIRRVVFRYLLPSGAAASTDARYCWFLRLENRKDPSAEFISTIGRPKIRILPGSLAVDDVKIRDIDASDANHALQSIRNKDDGSPGCIVSIESITWTSESVVEVIVGEHRGPRSSTVWSYNMNNVRGDWQVVNTSIIQQS
jgi:hypothetical protein